MIGHAWPLTQLDVKKVRPFVPHKTMVGQERKDNSVYPLTTTYHE